MLTNNITIIEIIKILKMEENLKEVDNELIASHQKDNPLNLNRIEIGKHFLSQIKKFKNEMIFDKINEIERKDEGHNYKEYIEKELEFF